MIETKGSYRRILKNSSIIGGASFANIAVGLVRTKALAFLLGPIGVGIVSLYNGFLNAASNIATMGLGTVGTRQIAQSFSAEDEHALLLARRAMFWGTMLLTAAAAILIWSLRFLLALYVFGSTSYSYAIGWLAVGVGLIVAAASQSALLQGMCRIGDMARVKVIAAIINAVLGIAFIWRWGIRGIIGYVLIGPIATLAVGHFYVSRLPKAQNRPTELNEIAREWATLLRLGLAYVGGGLSLTVSQLWIRIYIERILGTAVLGQYQASWMVSMYYVSFVLTAMGTDYYPRLAGVIRNREAAVRLVNEQTEVALLLSTPIFVAMIAATPWVIRVLYSALFARAVVLLRWQVMGDVFKVASWPLGFIMLAAGDGKAFFWSELSANLLTAVLITVLLPSVGLKITGISYFVTYVYYLPLVYWLARRRFGFRWSRPVGGLIVTAFMTCAVVGILAFSCRWGMAIGCGISILLVMLALGRLAYISDFGGPLGRLREIGRKVYLRRKL